MKRSIIILNLFLVSVLFISGCAQMAARDTQGLDYFTFLPDCIIGDINGDESLNVLDVIALVNCILNELDCDLVNDEGGAQGISALVEFLDVDEDLATVLVNEGYSTLALVSSSNNEDLAKIEGLDRETADLLITRSKEALLTLAMEISSLTDNETEDLISVEGVNMALAIELNQKGIKTRNDLAEQSVDELIELVNMDEKKAGELIMKAREYWFNEE